MGSVLEISLVGLLLGALGAASATAEPGDPSLVAAAVEHIREREYQPSESTRGLQAPNRRHGFRAWFESTGVRFEERLEPGAGTLFALRTRAVQRGNHRVEIEPGAVVEVGRRVEIRRPDFVEWFENSRDGLEQGFTLARRPAGEGDFAIEIVVEGARAESSGEGISIRDENGRRFRYDKLVVVDAVGRPLDARMHATNEHLVRVVVVDRDAQYPITIDPLLTGTPDGQIESNQASAFLGLSVAAAGDVNGDGFADVIVGAHQYDSGQSNEGAAFIFHGSAAGIPAGTPASAATFIQSNQSNAHLGRSVAGAGDVNGDGYADVIIGAPLYNNGQSDEGLVLIYHGSAAGIPDGNLSTSNNRFEVSQADSQLGLGPGGVASAGDVNADGYADVIVGAPYYDDGQIDEGAAWILHGGPNGVSVVHVVKFSAVDTEIQSNQAGAMLGRSVAGAGSVNGDAFDDVIVGAENYDPGALPGAGAAFVFHGSATGVADGNPATAHTVLESDQSATAFGYSVDGAGDVNGDGDADVIVGAFDYTAGALNSGAAFVFYGDDFFLSPGIPDATAAAALTRHTSNQTSAELGKSVAGAGDVNGDGYADVIVGAPFYDAGSTNEGAAFVFMGGAGTMSDGDPSTADATLELDPASSFFGQSVDGAGDVNGDGYADVIVGAWTFDNGQNNEGGAFVYLGGPEAPLDGDPTTASGLFESNQGNFFGGAQLGVSVANAGDVNGDGIPDLILGADEFDAGQPQGGAAFIFHGAGTGLPGGDPLSAATQLDASVEFADFGWSVAGAGDLNADGYADVIVGAPTWDDPLPHTPSTEGAAFIFHGGPGGVPSGDDTTATTRIIADQSGSGSIDMMFGTSVAGAGDVNGDGFPDVVVGAPRWDSSLSLGSREGAAFVFHAWVNGVIAEDQYDADATLQGESSNVEDFGFSVASAGDTNGDGYADLIIGAPGYTLGGSGSATNEGAALIYEGGPAGVGDNGTFSADARLESNDQDARFGQSVSSAGDVNGDGFADVIVGSVDYDNGEVDEGAAFVFHGGPAGFSNGNPSTADAILESNQPNSEFGAAVSSAGDVNGDGFADVIVGSPNYTAGESAEGAAFVFLGSGAGVSSGSPATSDAFYESNQSGAMFGASASSAGDLNGDGLSEVVVGASRYSNGENEEGAAFVFEGGVAPGRAHRLRQQRSDGSLEAPAWGVSDDPDGFRVRLFGSHPEGRGRVKIEVEACAPGLPFDDPGCVRETSGSWIDAPGTVTHTLTGLTDGELYRWRARALHAPLMVIVPAVTEAPNPPHGPWRRFDAQAVDADIRTMPEPGLGVGLVVAVLALAARARRVARRDRARGVRPGNGAFSTDARTRRSATGSRMCRRFDAADSRRAGVRALTDTRVARHEECEIL